MIKKIVKTFDSLGLKILPKREGEINFESYSGLEMRYKDKNNL